jgi:short-subunit dehydrogenase involved in D-alanine esterification of teichoic acids
MSLPFQTAVITGGGGGLGKAVAEWLIQEGKKVILVGRTESNLQTTSKELNNSPYYVLDTGNVTAIPEFAKKVISEHPDVDCLINNAGVQRPLQFENLDLDKADQEININIRGPMHLTVAFLPHFRTKSHATIVNVSSVLGFVPFSIINPVYNGTKAFLHFHTMNMRSQLKKTDPNITVIEIAPPAVGTDLHREREDPDDNKKHKNPNSLTVEEFMDDIVPQWKNGETFITAGPLGHGTTSKWYENFGEQYNKADAAWNQ